nr:reverse transcriptase domain-containing protein [Tanacetum cinerariifolium]
MSVDSAAPRSPEYVPDPIELEDHVRLHIPEHPEDLVPTEDEAHIEAYILEDASAPTPPLPPSFLSLRIRPLHTRAAMAQMRAAVPSTYHSLLPSGTPPLLPIPLPIPSTNRRAKIPEADTPPRKRLLLTAPRPGYEVGESSAVATARQSRPIMTRSVDRSFVDTMETRFQDTERRMMTALEMVNMRDRAAVRAEIKVLRRERLAYEQESIQICEALARSEAYSRTLEARVAVLETQVRRHEWQRQTTDDFAVQHIMHTQALEAGARIDTLEDTGNHYVSEPFMYVFQFIYGMVKKMAPKRTTRSTSDQETTNTTSVTNAQLQAMIDQGVATTLAVRDALRSTNGNDSHNSGTGVRRTKRATRECTYTDFLKSENQVKFATCTLHSVALTLWNTHVKTVGHDAAYGLPDMIHRSVVASKPKTMQEAVAIATEPMDQKIRTFAEREMASKRKKEHAGTLPLCNKCKFHHNGQCTIKCTNYKRVGHLTRDCRSPAAINNHRNPTCYECGNQGHYKSDCPELKNQDHGNQVGGTEAHGMVHVLKGGETNQDPNDMEDDINA